MTQLIFASNNANKLKEIALLLPIINLKTLADIGCTIDLPETQATIEGNALQKAKYISDNFSVNCFADDTGLLVEALNGEPGVYSARYAGLQKDANDNMDLLLKNLFSWKIIEKNLRTRLAIKKEIIFFNQV